MAVEFDSSSSVSAAGSGPVFDGESQDRDQLAACSCAQQGDANFDDQYAAE